MFVHHTARRRGLGAALIEAVSAWARDCGAGQVSLWVAEGNDRALSLYQGLGFRLTGVTQPLAHTPSLLDREMVRDLEGAGTCGDGGSSPTVPAS
jgi:RimJ/RimL family protein N-acetyltransferase